LLSTIPIALLRILDLRQRSEEGVFYTSTGELAAFDPSLAKGFDGLVIRKDFLERFLEISQYDLIWYCYGEKQYFFGNSMQQWLTVRGLFHFEGGNVCGN